MLLASRASPPKQLQVPTQSRNTAALKEFLLHSPLPSPALPSILPRHGKKPPALNTRRTLRYISWLFIVTTTIYLVLFIRSLRVNLPSDALEKVYQHTNGHAYEIVEDSQLPDYASPLAVTDSSGSSRWTIHIPSNRGFPLQSQEYSEICSHIDDVARHVAIAQGQEEDANSKRGYYDADPNYVDVAEAQLNDLIPFDPNFVPTKPGQLPVCKSSLIYILDASDAGLGGSLLGLWLSYGLAQREKRSFFIDDSHFAYGRYSSLFEPPSRPNCRPAPPTHRVPCPRMSQHLVVTASTWSSTFGNTFHKKFNDKEVFELMRVGYEGLFKLLPDDQLYVAQRVTELRTILGEETLLAGMHIRRGDKHPEEFQYQWGYVPFAKYLEALTELVSDTSSFSLTTLEQPKHSRKLIFVLASDDEAVYHDPELQNSTIRAQERIDLAHNNQLSNPLNEGWERGFYSSAFWGLGLPRQARTQQFNLAESPSPTKDTKYEQRVLGISAANGEEYDPHRDYRSNPTAASLRLRNHIGRSYLLDLAVLAQSDRLVCTASSRGCRILGVMMGWEKVQKGWWRNIDRAGEVSWRAQL
ncbi:hypothetical protein LTR64_006377 [Lithohypha guttulata]|uniref:uncharacterized protein n=1 Tax=Lithohypha guttulata TaxID=1690604 RepID=UPI002DDFB906|nr:hypothetical protein LTR51_001826 [Lithohypha guttulata]